MIESLLVSVVIGIPVGILGCLLIMAFLNGPAEVGEFMSDIIHRRWP